ncbi:MAG: hypothetical protein IT329_21260 [Caldilineaceae bacterium]|nr:hypothetical protein [Caldilineaceae bacterium]
MTLATLMGTGMLRGREGRGVRVEYLLENSPDLLSLGPSQQPGTLMFLEGDTALIYEHGPLLLDLQTGRGVQIRVEDTVSLDKAGTRYAIWWW